MNRFNLWQIALPPAYASAQCNSFWLYYVFRFAFLQLRLLHVAHWPFCHMADLPLYVFGAMTSRRLAFHFHLIVVEEANGNVTKSQLHCSATAPPNPAAGHHEWQANCIVALRQLGKMEKCKMRKMLSSAMPLCMCLWAFRTELVCVYNSAPHCEAV